MPQALAYGIVASDSSTFTVTNPLITIDVSATSDGMNSEIFAYGINAEERSTVSLGNATITVQNKTDHQLDYNTAYGVTLGLDSQFHMRDGSILWPPLIPAEKRLPEMPSE